MKTKVTTEQLYVVNGDTYYQVYLDGEPYGSVRDCLSRGDNFHAVALRNGKLVGRYFSTLRRAANWRVKQVRG